MILFHEYDIRTLRQKQTRQGQSLVDGSGIERIGDEIIRMPKMAGEFVRQ